MSPISSRNKVPPSACSKRPRRKVCAPVKAPRSCPNSSDSRRSFGIAAVFIAMNGLSARGPWRCNARATRDRKSTRLNSSHDQISYAVFCLKKKTKHKLFPADLRNKQLNSSPQKISHAASCFKRQKDTRRYVRSQQDASADNLLRDQSLSDR